MSFIRYKTSSMGIHAYGLNDGVAKVQTLEFYGTHAK